MEIDILTIGKRFDLAHSFKTGYRDFLDFSQNVDFKDYINNLLIIKIAYKPIY